MSRSRQSPRCLIAVTTFLVAGCGEEWGPEPMMTTRVEGSVAVDGRPLTSGWVEFLPVGGTVGNMRTAPIGTDGRFAADKVPVGRVAVALPVLSGPPIATAFGGVPLSEFRMQSTPIRRAIPAGSALRLDLDLGTEAREARRRRFSTSPPAPGTRAE